MFKAPPLTGAYTVLQNFGDNPEKYKKYNLLGHEGIDLQAPAGRQVTAVQSGAVLRVRPQNARFGQAVILKHEWGESLYGHITGVNVAVGEKVQAGQPIAAVGLSPGGPVHLHFGIRVRPYIYADGWSGFSDPAPYLARLTKPRARSLDHTSLVGCTVTSTCLRNGNRVITVLDPNPDEMAELRLACPAATIIGRIFAPDADVESRIRANPESAAEWAHNLTMARMTPHVNFWQIANEVLQTVQTLPLLARFEIRRMQLASSAMYFCAIFAFSVGNPDMPTNDRMAAWRLAYPAMEMAEKGGHAVAVHQYGKPDIWTPDQDWYGYRLEHQVLKLLPFKKLQFIVSEYGIDGTINGGARQGWQQFATPEAYVNSLVFSAKYLERFSGRVLGNTVFALGQTSPWQTFDIAGTVAQGLADKLPRGTWANVQTEGTGIAPGRPPKPPAGKETGTPTPPPTVERRLTDWFDDMRMSVKTIEERPDHPTGDVVYLVKDVFTTHNGSWDVNGQLYSAPQWAKDAYLSGAFTKAYERNNLYAAVIGLDGKYIYGQEVLHWTGGIDKLIDLGSTTYAVLKANENPGWSTMVMYSSSSYNPGAGLSGPWCWTPNGLPAEVICGGGLPNGEAVSTFVVWQAVAKAPTTPTPKPTDPVDPTPKPTDPVDPTPTPSPITRRLGTWVDDLRIQIKTLADRPDPAIPGDIVYVIKDIFTTRDGSWELPSNVYGIDQWARDAYLKPWGDPEYFDDAGADHHIFGAMLDESGKLIKNFDFLYWSDGFAKLGDPNYSGYVMGSNGNRYPKTKDKSGWVNIPLESGSNYVPERGESGPWCWTPRGVPAEVICGGGMPAKNHVSFFVVWQAVRRSSLTPTPTATATSTVTPTPTEAPVLQPLPEGSFHLFMPSLQNTEPGAAVQALESDFDEERPVADASSPIEAMRTAAWGQIGIEYTPASTLARYARMLGLGAPITDLFDVAGFIAQGFHGGIVYAASDDQERPAHIPW
ncbi:MAG: M23 family metallopeptidase [Anaerolineales bacterium]|nr:M23 family metallopeptidase [Anaerolineales bacterium]